MPGVLVDLLSKLEKIDLIQLFETNSNLLKFQEVSPPLITGMI
jgi:hypothetical protein